MIFMGLFKGKKIQQTRLHKNTWLNFTRIGDVLACQNMSIYVCVLLLAPCSIYKITLFLLLWQVGQASVK